jgi:hypothetical protein
MNKLSREQRAAMLREYRAGKSSGQLARKYRVHDSYPRLLAHMAKRRRPIKAA